MKMLNVSEFFKRYLPSKLPEKDIVKFCSERDVSEILKIIGIDISSHYIVHDSEEITVTFKKVDFGKWKISVKFK